MRKEPLVILIVSGGDPGWTNNYDEGFAGDEGALQDFYEVISGLDVVGIDEHAFFAEAAYEAVVKPAGVGGTVSATVTDEDAGQVADPPGIDIVAQTAAGRLSDLWVTDFGLCLHKQVLSLARNSITPCNWDPKKKVSETTSKIRILGPALELNSLETA